MPRSRYYLEHMGLCTICGKRPADKGYKTCLTCRMDKRAKGDNHSEAFKQKHKLWLKRYRDLCYAFGVCIVCKKRDAESNSHVCRICNHKAKIRAEKNRRSKGVLARDSYTKDGICYFCNEKSLDGKKVCKKHYRICCENMKKARNSNRTDVFREANAQYWKWKGR